ncbi:MAG: Alkaline phosphatase PafA [Burkholderiaceae bacterium]|nr:Alkaline phosphatase PafA [Burkholderiaceae bacterium]
MKSNFRLRSLLALLLGCALAACGHSPSGPSAPPRLVVFMAVDGLPQRQVVDYRSQLAPDGLARFLDRGAWFANAHYGYAYTVTAAGHASMLTGTYAYRHGIIGNDWRNLETGEVQYCTGDARYTYIGNATGKLDGTSPNNLLVETVGDVLKRSNPRSKVIGISGKDRGAILPAGKTGVAYMYMSKSGQFASSTFYMKEHPAWVDAFNAAKPADRYFKQPWRPMLEDGAYRQSLADAQPWFLIKGAGLPMTMGHAQEKPDGAYYSGLLRGPFVDEMALEFARAAIKGEALGQDDAPDILTVSLSGHDYVNHAFSAESRLSHDHLLQLDRLFQAFFKDLDALVGKDNYVAVLTADHGFMPAPETSLAAGRNAGRQSASQALARVNAGLAQKFGAGTWAKFFSASALVLDHKLIDERKVDRLVVQEEARSLLLKEEGIAVVYTRDELAGNTRAGAPLFDPMRKSWNAQRSGDLQVALKPYWMFTSSSSTTTHGSPHPYDTNVPILFYGPRWVKRGMVSERVEVSGVAPTLAGMLRIAPPATSEGKVLPIVVGDAR